MTKIFEKKILSNRPKSFSNAETDFRFSLLHTYYYYYIYESKQTNTKYCKEPPQKKKENTPCIIKITADRGRQRFKKKTHIYLSITLKVVIHDKTKIHTYMQLTIAKCYECYRNY